MHKPCGTTNMYLFSSYLSHHFNISEAAEFSSRASILFVLPLFLSAKKFFFLKKSPLERVWRLKSKLTPLTLKHRIPLRFAPKKPIGCKAVCQSQVVQIIQMPPRHFSKTASRA